MIKKYKEYDLFDLALQMVGAKQISSQSPERELIRNLLPINSAFGYYHNDTFTCKDPRDGKVYSESFNNGDEEGRKGAIKRINERIREYNNFLEELKEKEGIKKTFELKYFPQGEVWMWGIHFVMSRPTIKQKNRYGQEQDHFGILQINNEFCYTRGLQLEMEDYVPRFNKMMYDYINKLIPKNMPFNKHNLFYKPITEFNNWFMLRGLFVDEVPTLIDDPPADSVEVKKSVHQETEDSISEKHQLTNELRVSHNKVQMQKREIKILKSGFTNNELERAAYLTMKNTGTLNFAKLGRLIGKSDNGARNILKERLPHLYLQHQQKDIYQLDDIDTICPACGNTFDEPPCTSVRK